MRWRYLHRGFGKQPHPAGNSDGIIQTISGGDGTSLNAPGGLVLDGSGDVYFADIGSNLIRKLTPQASGPARLRSRRRFP